MSGNASYTETVETARSYYNSDDADRFYATIWGGEDIHIGLYESESEPIAEASRRTVATMAARLEPLAADARVLDLGSGYGGSARFLTQKSGCPVTCLNLSEVQNDRNRVLNQEAGVMDRIQVVDGDFEALPFPDADFDVVWSQDAILHSGNRRKVLEEVHRVSRPGARFLFTDPMQTDDCDVTALKPVLDRIHLDSLGSPGFYRKEMERLGWKEIAFEEHTNQLVRHYSRVREEIIARDEELEGICSRDYRERMKAGLQHWVDAGNAGRLCWGIFLFERPA